MPPVWQDRFFHSPRLHLQATTQIRSQQEEEVSKVIQEGKEQGPHATPAGKEASPVGSVHEPQNEDVKAEVEEVPVEGEQEQEQEAVGERKLKTTVTGALRCALVCSSFVFDCEHSWQVKF
eukprot:1161512-Pelagomonas_calceolata.AAC.24